MNSDLQPGDKVRNNYGETLTVVSTDGVQVFVREQPNRWYHPTKVWKVRDTRQGSKDKQ